MEHQFVDRILICSDCRGEFIFTAGEQLFFHDKQFKNDPKRCKPCKSRRSGLSAVANATGPAAAGISRTETRTDCSECGIQTTVPFKPTQGRPVLCRQCFQAKARAVPTPAPTPPSDALAAQPLASDTASALQDASLNSRGETLSAAAAVAAAAAMDAASPRSSVASAADLASISPDIEPGLASSVVAAIPASLVAAAAKADSVSHLQELHVRVSDQG
jgi:CxxC-x17-CxxC domain-containing protein